VLPSPPRTSVSPVEHHRHEHKRHRRRSRAGQRLPFSTKTPEKCRVRASDNDRDPIQRLVLLEDAQEPDGVDAD
jgi:hypothetical protein